MEPNDDIDNFDFGFTFEQPLAAPVEIIDATLIDQIQQLTDTNYRLDKTIDQLYHTIIPFLDNLCNNPDVPNIHWPNRVEKIDQFKQKLQQIIATGKQQR